MLGGSFLLVAAVGLTASAAARCAALLAPTGPAPRSELCLRAGVVGTFFVVAPAATLGLLGQLNAGALMLAAVALYLASRGVSASFLPPRTRGETGGWRALRWPALVSALVVALDFLTRLPSPPVAWDAMTYHLYQPARWLQEGGLFHVPTVFSDNAAAFAPQNGALFFAWQMALSRRDALVNVSQLFCLLLLALALYRLCRHLGVAREPAALAALTVLWLEPLRHLAVSANVDVFIIAFWLAALYWLLLALRRPQLGVFAVAGLAAGLAAGTKTLGLPLVGFSAVVPLLWLFGRRHFGGLALYLVVAAAGGGWWTLRSAWLYGNPLFPLDVSLGPLRLAGAYDSAAVRAGEFHLEGLGAVAASVWRQFGPVVCVLLILGVLALGGGALRATLKPDARDPSAGRRRAAEHWLLFALAVLWMGFFVWVVPHNNQARFLLPALVLSLVGWGRALQWAGRRLGAAAPRGLWLLAAAVLLVVSRPWQGWRMQLATLAEAEVDAVRWLVVAGLGGALAIAAFALANRQHRWPRAAGLLLAGWVLVAVLVALAARHADASRPAFLAAADFRGWAEGYLPFARPDAPPLSIAYTGANVPYTLLGSGWRSRAVYVNTQGNPGDGFYDFWSRDRRRHPYHKPGIYRGRDDYETWLSHLDAERVDLVVIFALHWAERRYLHATPEGFPVEQAWVRQHPERFAPVLTGRAAEIYRLLP